MQKKHILIHPIEKPVNLQEENWNSRFWLDKIPEYCSSRYPIRKPVKNNTHKSVHKLIDSSNVAVSLQKNSSAINFPYTIPPIPKSFQQKRKTASNVLHNRISFQGNPKLRISEMRQVSKNFIAKRKLKQGFLASTQGLKPFPCVRTLPTEAEHVLNSIQDISSSNLSDSSEVNKESEVYLIVYDKILCESLFPLLKLIIEESINEGILAYLTLSSGKILYLYINEVINSLIPSLAKAWYEESKEQEPINLRDQISRAVEEEEIAEIVQTSTLEILSNLAFYQILEQLPLVNLVEDCLKEIEAENKEKQIEIFDYLVNSIISEDWVEVLVEDTVTLFRLEGVWQYFPVYLQKEISKKQHNIIVGNISEEIYFDILNKDLMLWLGEICKEEFERFI